MQRRRIVFGAFVLGFGATIGFGCGQQDEPDAVSASVGPASGPTAWARVFGAEGDQFGLLTEATAAGTIVTVGTMAGTVDFGQGGKLTAQSDSDLYVAWLGRDGAIQKAKSYGGGGKIMPLGLAADASGGLAISGLAEGDVDFGGGKLSGQDVDAILVSLGPNQQYRYALRASGPGMQIGGDTIVGPDGNTLWIGSFEGSINIGGTQLQSAGGADVFVAKISPSGQTIWARALGGTGEESDLGLTIDAKGRVLVAGLYQGAPDLGKGALPDTTDQTDGEMLVALDANGQTLWSRGTVNKDGFYPFTLQKTDDGAVYLVGQLSGQVNAFGQNVATPSVGIAVVKIDDAGAAQSTQVIAADRASHIVSTRQKGGGLVLAGHFGGKLVAGGKTLTSAGSEDLFALWMDAQGKITREERLGGAGRERLGDITMTPSGQIVVTGTFDGTTNFGAGNVSSAGGPDGFTAMLR